MARVTQAEAAALIDISVQRFRDLVKEGVLSAPGGKTGYDEREVVHGYIRYLRAKARSPVEEKPKPHVVDPKDAIDRAKLEKYEMDNAIRKREYAPIRLFGIYVEKVGAVIHSHFEAMVGRIKQRIPHLRAAEIAIIRNELAKCASGIADFDVIDESAV